MAKKTLEEDPPQNENHKKVDEKNEKNEEPDFSDPADFVDDVTDEELLGDILKGKPSENSGIENVVVVDGVPQVDPSRFKKLESFVHNLFSKCGTVVSKHFPKHESGMTKGYAFIEFSDAQSALISVKTMNNYVIDKNHTFKVNLLTDFEKYDNIQKDWTPDDPEPYQPIPDLYSYLLDADAYDQFCVSAGKGSNLKVQIWQHSVPEPFMITERPRWTESYIKWSPLGTYLTTMHSQGVACWGGPKFKSIKFNQSGVECVDFSPCERYLVTYAPLADHKISDARRLIIWDVLTQKKKREFVIEGSIDYPLFRWSHDDKYVAKTEDDIISVYETPSFRLLDKKSIKIQGIHSFSWSPTDNVIAYWVPEDKDVPARFTLMEIPNRVEIRNTNLFNVSDCMIYWQKSGDYLCVKVDRYAKRKEKTEQKYTGMSYNFEIFHMREKNIPVDSVEIKERIHAFAWEPIGTKFAIIHGEVPNVNISFYKVRCGHKPALLKKLEKRACNSLFWSPSGQFIVLAGTMMNGALEFIDTSDFTIMNSTDHYQVSDVEWDPTGRYVVTYVNSYKTSVDNAYWIWTFQGRILKRINCNGLAQFLWRPRPPTLLSREQIKDIKKNLKKYSTQFESKDRMRMSKASKELIEKRRALMSAFDELRQKRIAQWNAQKADRMALRRGIDTDELDSDTQNVEEECIEFFVKQEIFPMDK